MRFKGAFLKKTPTINQLENDQSSFIREEAGFSLLIVLLAISIIGGAFSSMLWYRSDAAIQRQAYAAGWQAFEIAKATRVFVRNATLNPVNLTSGVACCTQAQVQAQGGFIAIPLQDLINAGHLPAGFNARSPLDQQFTAYAGSYPLVPNPLAAGFPITGYLTSLTAGGGNRAASVASARTAAAMMQGAREAGLSSSAPLVVGGINQSEDCNPGDPAVVIWDTGCIGQTEWANATNTISAGGIPINAGDIIVPTWRAIDHDLRALMRYPQPENVGANTMLTDLHFGDATNFAANPDTAGNDNRVNINNLNGLDVSQLVLADQGAGVNVAGSENEQGLAFSSGALTFNQLVMSVGGNVVAQQDMTATTGAELGQALVGDGQVNIASGLSADDLIVTGDVTMNGNAVSLNSGNMSVTGATTAIGRAAFTTIGSAGAVNNLNVGSIGVAGPGQTVTNAVNNLEAFQLEGAANVFNAVQMTGGVVDISGANPYNIGGNPYGARFGAITGANDVDAAAGTTVRFENGAAIGTLSARELHVNRCSGQCPDEESNNPVNVNP